MNFLLALYSWNLAFVVTKHFTGFCSPAAPCVDVIGHIYRGGLGEAGVLPTWILNPHLDQVHLERLSSPTARDKLPQLMCMGDWIFWNITQFRIAQPMHACSCHELMSQPIPFFLKHNLNQQKCLKIVFRETTSSTYSVAKNPKWQNMAWGFMN